MGCMDCLMCTMQKLLSLSTNNLFLYGPQMCVMIHFFEGIFSSTSFLLQCAAPTTQYLYNSHETILFSPHVHSIPIYCTTLNNTYIPHTIPSPLFLWWQISLQSSSQRNEALLQLRKIVSNTSVLAIDYLFT
jgi:hypothetical protein